MTRSGHSQTCPVRDIRALRRGVNEKQKITKIGVGGRNHFRGRRCHYDRISRISDNEEYERDTGDRGNDFCQKRHEQTYVNGHLEGVEVWWDVNGQKLSERNW